MKAAGAGPVARRRGRGAKRLGRTAARSRWMATGFGVFMVASITCIYRFDGYKVASYT
jgi:hypothetical protein